MKKQLFLMAIMAGAFCLTSCNPKDPVTPPTPPTPGGDTTKVDVKVTVSPHEVVLTAEESTIRLAATLEPQDASVTIAWSSSDTLVATVTERGIVEAIGYGDCFIYATAGDAKDSCHVFVKSYLETLLFNSAIVWSKDTTYAQDPETGKMKVDTIKAGDGSTYYAYKSMALLRVFSDGMYVNSSGYIDGTAVGTMIDIYAPMYYAPAWLNNASQGTVFCLGEWDITDDIQYMRQGEPGKISDEAEYVKQMKLFIDSYNAGSASSTPLKAASNLFEGATLTVLEYDAENEGYVSSYIPEAVCDEAVLFLNGDFPASPYMCGMDYSEVKFSPLAFDWGMHIDQEEDGTLYLVDEEIHWDEQIVSVYGEYPAETKAYTPLHAPIISEHPELKASLEKQIKEKNIRVIKTRKF